MVAASIPQGIGVLAAATMALHSLKNTSKKLQNNLPPPPTCNDKKFGDYCIKSVSTLKDKKTNKDRRIYKGYAKTMDISTKVDKLCTMTKKNLNEEHYCTHPEVTFNRHVYLCDGRVEIHHAYSNKITIIK